MAQQRAGWSREFKVGLAVTAFVTVVAATGAPWWTQYLRDDAVTDNVGSGADAGAGAGADIETGSSSTGETGGMVRGVGAPSPIAGMSGGCEPFQVFAQNRWEPYGTAIREQPNVLSNQIGSFPGNMSISVNGWVHGRAAYTTNTPPFNNDVWYHLSNGTGWVSFPGVRATPVAKDPTGLSDDGGTPAAMSASCEGSVR